MNMTAKCERCKNNWLYCLEYKICEMIDDES